MSCLTRGPWARPLSGAAIQAWAKPNFSSPKDALCTAWKWLSVYKLSKILHVENKDRWPCFKGVCLSYISILLYLQRILVIVFFFFLVCFAKWNVLKVSRGVPWHVFSYSTKSRGFPWKWFVWFWYAVFNQYRVLWIWNIRCRPHVLTKAIRVPT